MKKVLITIYAIFLFLIIPLTFILQDLLITIIDPIFKFKVNPKMTGGEILVSFIDPMNDDKGDGNLIYPKNEIFDGKRYLDLVRYTVYKPLVKAVWAPLDHFWRLDLTFSDVKKIDDDYGFIHPVINIYISYNNGEGSTKTFYARNEMVEFDTNYPWNFFITVNGYKKEGEIYSFDKTYTNKVKVLASENTKTVSILIPLTDKRINQVLDGRPTYHYVLIGAYDPYTRGNFMQVREKEGINNGGGAKSSITPKVYDYLAPRGYKQFDILSKYDENTLSYAILKPVKVEKPTNIQKIVNQDLIKKYEELAKMERNKEKEKNELNIKKLLESNTTNIELLKLYFKSENFNKAEEILNILLKENPEDPVLLAYLGSFTAMKAGSAKSPSDQIKFVNDSFSIFDKSYNLAIKNKVSDNEMINILLNRAGVYTAIPDFIFNKANDGIKDYLECIKILERSNPNNFEEINSLYLAIALTYENIGKKNDSEIYFTLLSESKNLTAQQKLELLKRGYEIEE